MIYLLPILAVLLSFTFVFIAKPKNKESIKLVLAFSGAFLLALTVFELFPEVYENSNPKTIGVCIMLGILFQIFLEFFSKGAEHGHVHFDTEKTNFPWLLFISLSLHSLLEGILHISTVILFETSEGHKFNLRKLVVIMIGIAIAYLL